MAKIIFVNAGTVFPMVMAAIKPILAEKTIARLQVFDYDYEAWLLQHVGSAGLQCLCSLRTRAAYSTDQGDDGEGGGGMTISGSLSANARWRADLDLPPARTISWDWRLEAREVNFQVRLESSYASAAACTAVPSPRSLRHCLCVYPLRSW